MINKKLQNILLVFGLAASIEVSSLFLEKLKADQTPTEITIIHHNQAHRPLDIAICDHAKKLNAHLNEQYNETLFNTKLLKDPQKTDEHLTLSKDQNGHGAQNLSITTVDGEQIGTTFIDHQSDILLIIGSGFKFDRRSLASFACYEPDIVLFQPRGHGIDHKPKTKKGQLSFNRIGVDSSVCKLGHVEEHDVIAVTEHYKQEKQYKSVIYLGICYSAVIGAKAAALRPDLFDKLILDGAWPSLKLLIERIIKNPYLYSNPQTSKKLISFIANNTLYFNSVRFCAEKFFDFKFDDAIEGSAFFPKLNKPILFFQGLNDTLVPCCDFNAVWDMTNHISQKVAILTPSRHIQGHIKHKELYHMLCHMFINNDFETFKQMLEGTIPLPEDQRKKIETTAQTEETNQTLAPIPNSIDILEISTQNNVSNFESISISSEQGINTEEKNTNQIEI